MKSWRGQVSFVGLATVAVALLVHGCQSPEGFHLTPDADDSSGTGGDGSGTGGVDGGGNGSGGASNGTGGQGSGGVSGTGGVAIGTGGRATGGGGGGAGGRSATGGMGGHGGAARGAGGAARGGSGATAQGGRGGRSGSGGAGGRGGAAGRGGAGGRGPFGFSDSNCLTDLQANGYAYGTSPGCSACNDNGMSLETKCEAVIDCLAPQWPCSGNCVTQCYNMAGASGPVMSCVSALTTAACGM